MGGKEGREEEEEDSGVGVGNVERGPSLPLFSSFSWHCGRGRSVVLTRPLLHYIVCGGGRRTEDEVGGRRKGLLLFPGPEGERDAAPPSSSSSSSSSSLYSDPQGRGEGGKDRSGSVEVEGGR